MSTNITANIRTLLQERSISLFGHEIRFYSPPGLRKWPDLETIKVELGELNVAATIATFLAAVQTQIIGISHGNNSTSVEVATNVLAFAGVILDVITAFLALLASTVTQRHIYVIERQLAAIKFLPPGNIDSSQRQLMELESSSHLADLGVFNQAILECEARLVESRDYDSIELPPRNAEFNILTLKASCKTVQDVACFGDAAGATMQWGMICFLSSVLCLAVSTQPPVVWKISAAACSSIVVLPFLNWIMGLLLKMRVPSVFSL